MRECIEQSDSNVANGILTSKIISCSNVFLNGPKPLPFFGHATLQIHIEYSANGHEE